MDNHSPSSVDTSVNLDVDFSITANTTNSETSKFLKNTTVSNYKPTIIPSLISNNNNKNQLQQEFKQCDNDDDKKEPFIKGQGSDYDFESEKTRSELCESQASSKKEKTARTGWKRYIGIILALMSSMIFPLAGLIVKALPQYHPFSVTFWRFQGILLPAIPIVIYHRCVKKEPIFDTVLPISAPGRWKTVTFLVLRGFTGATAVVLQFYSLQFISMADSSVISFSTPVFVTLVAHVFLGEKCGIIPVISGVFALAGVAVITRPPMLTGAEEFDKDNVIGASLALCCMVFATSTFVLLRYLRQLHYGMIQLFFGLWGTGETLLLSLAVSTFQVPKGLEHWLLALSLAMLTCVGQLCITLAFKFEQAGTVSLCRTTDVIFAFIWQFLFLGVVPDRYSVIGASVVIIGILLVGFRKWVNDLPVDDKTRKTFSWILK